MALLLKSKAHINVQFITLFLNFSLLFVFGMSESRQKEFITCQM